MTLSDQLKHPRADMRIQAKKKVEMLARLRAELRKARPWWIEKEEA